MQQRHGNHMNIDKKITLAEQTCGHYETANQALDQRVINTKFSLSLLNIDLLWILFGAWPLFFFQKTYILHKQIPNLLENAF